MTLTAVVGVAGYAAADALKTHDPAAPDFADVLVHDAADIPFATDDARQASMQDQLKFAARDARNEQRSGEKSGYSDKAIRAETARHAICSWANAWAQGTTSGDTAERDHAIAMLQQARTWPAVTDVDAKQTITPKTMEVTDGKRTWQQKYLDNTGFGYLPLVVQAAQGHDLEAMGSIFVRWTFCPPSIVPDLPQAVPAPLRNR